MKTLKTAGTALTLAALLGTAAPAALAHHSFPATYEVDKVVTIQGTVVQFLFRNPHSHRLRMRAITRPSDGWTWSGTFG